MKPPWLRKVAILAIVSVTLTGFVLLVFRTPENSHEVISDREVLTLVTDMSTNETANSNWKKTCQFHTCFEINDCWFGIKDKISVFVYPDYYFRHTDSSGGKMRNKLFQLESSPEYLELLETIRSSEYYEPVPSKACVFVPSIDMLNQRGKDPSLISRMLLALPWWNEGQNHIVFSMLPGEYPTYSSIPDVFYGRAMLAGSSLDVTNYRMDYDISLPVFNSLTKTLYTKEDLESLRPHFLTVLSQVGSVSQLFYQHWFSGTTGFTSTTGTTGGGSHGVDVVLLGSCEQCPQCSVSSRCGLLTTRNKDWQYPQVLKESVYCLILPGYRKDSPDFLDILMTGCIPVVLRNTQRVLPFSEVLDWNRGVVYVWEEELPHLLDILKGLPESVRKEKRLQIQYLYARYFSSMESIAMTTLHILNSRVFPLAAGSYESWNNQPYDSTAKDYFQYSYPLPLDLPPSQESEGFTAIILAYDRLQLLYQTIVCVAHSPSLAMILIVWNNLEKHPPNDDEWPQVTKPLKIIRAKENKLSNRFYPYQEIKTSAVLSLDDDITMLTPSEIEFGYKVWLEYPKQIVGYPGRVHWFDSSTGEWKYESEWMNNISVVLTGAAFYHKHYHYMYTHQLPTPIKLWVDKHFNCEDIAFNFMVSNYTGLPPIKVTPRKRFKCTNCTIDGLFTDVSHFDERNKCINLFSSFYTNGDVPLKTVKFRFDPVLFKVPDIPEDLMAFPEIGQL